MVVFLDGGVGSPFSSAISLRAVDTETMVEPPEGSSQWQNSEAHASRGGLTHGSSSASLPPLQ